MGSAFRVRIERLKLSPASDLKSIWGGGCSRILIFFCLFLEENKLFISPLSPIFNQAGTKIVLKQS